MWERKEGPNAILPLKLLMSRSIMGICLETVSSWPRHISLWLSLATSVLCQCVLYSGRCKCVCLLSENVLTFFFSPVLPGAASIF
jgi:hypothetical protein